MTVTDTASHKISSWNRQTYQRLKLALSLGLRRQIFVAVCDDLSLRDRLVDQLYADLDATSAQSPRDAHGNPKVVSLNLNLSDPNPLVQVVQWLAQNRKFRSDTPAPGFQILGVELLTRQPPAVQRLFLRRLQAIERKLLDRKQPWESTLLFWLPRPWFHTIQQSAPEFWQWHTSIFEFEGEPTPLPLVGDSKPEASPALAAPEEASGSFKEDLRTLLAHDLVKQSELSQDLRIRPPSSSLKRQPNLGETGFTPPKVGGVGEQNDGVCISPVSQEKPLPRDDSKLHPTDLETSTNKMGVTSSPVNNSGKAIAQLKLEEAAQEVEVPEFYLRLGDALEESEAHQIEELLNQPDAQISNPQSVESAEELTIGKLNVESLNFQHSNLPYPSGTASSVGTAPLMLNGNAYGEQPSIEQEQSASSPAEAYLELGNHYRHTIEQGDASEENLMIAIQAYEQALQWLEQGSLQASDILNDIGNLYWMLSRCPSCADHALSHLEQATQAYQLALTNLTAEEAPHTYSMIQNNLGAAYGDLARHKEPAESLEQSIRAYEEALRYRHAESEPIKYASTQNNLGTAHWNLAQHQSPVLHLREAIAAYAEALSYYDTKSEPLNWAMIQNNLGTAYWNLAQYEQPETWLHLATLAYQDALQHRTPEVAPAACAATLNNLGTAYWHLADRYQDEPQQKAEYLNKCIAAYESALALAGRQPFALTNQLSQNTPPLAVNFDVSATHNNLGLAHYQLATEPKTSLAQESKLSHLETALHQHVQACTGVTVQSDSYQTALNYIVKTIRAIYHEGGIPGQNRALSNIPGQLLPEILPRL